MWYLRVVQSSSFAETYLSFHLGALLYGLGALEFFELDSVERSRIHPYRLFSHLAHLCRRHQSQTGMKVVNRRTRRQMHLQMECNQNIYFQSCTWLIIKKDCGEIQKTAV